MVKQFLYSTVLAGALSLPLLASPALASADQPVPSTSSAAAPASALSSAVSDELILGRGTTSSPFGTAQFAIMAHPTVGPRGHHGDFRWDEADGNRYNGAIHGYQINGNTATIDGAGGLVDANGQRHHVTFTATIVEGPAGTGSIDVIYTGKDVSMHCQGTVTNGQIVFKTPPTASQPAAS